jgi:hydrogenase nickel incorporation protein HypA/HybF
MHELPITQSILDISLKHAQQAGAQRINSIYIVIGQLNSAVDDSIQFYWDIYSKGTIAEGAVLHFERVPAEITCLNCAEIFAFGSETYACPKCGSQKIKITKGEELRVDSIDVD